MDPTAFNPYAAPEEQTLSGSLLPAEPVTVRKQFIHCESNIKSIAGLMVLGGLLVAIGFCMVAVSPFDGPPHSDFLKRLGLILFVLAGLWQIYTGIQLRRLKVSARVPAAIACGLWILFVPVGTIVGGVSLWYLLRPAASFVFSEDYAEVVRKTPNVGASTSVAGWGLLMALIALLAFALIASGFLR